MSLIRQGQRGLIRANVTVAQTGLRGRRLASASTIPSGDAPVLPNPEVAEDPTPVLPPVQKDGYLFVDSVFPIRLGRWDLRTYIGLLRESSVLSYLNTILSLPSSDSTKHEFKLVSLEPHHKDGGVFVHFRYSVPSGSSELADDKALQDVTATILEQINKNGGIMKWTGLGRSDIWSVKGRPWREDLNRFPSPILRIAFDGPDLPEEALYALLRPYGRISQMDMPSSAPPPPTGVPRAAVVTFRHIRSATVARNVLHALDYQPIAGPTGSQPPRTRLRTAYQPPVQAHAVRDWISKHPRIAAPIALFLLGSLTYTVWDPIRTLMIEGRIMDWFDYTTYDTYRWLHTNVLAYLPINTAPPAASSDNGDDDDDDERSIRQEREAASPGEAQHHRSSRSRRRRKALGSGDAEDALAGQQAAAEQVWQARHDAAISLNRYLSDLPTTVAFLHGPSGAGKDKMLTHAIEDTADMVFIDGADGINTEQGRKGTPRRTLVIDVQEVLKQSADGALVDALAKQTGYWPVFTALNSVNTWVDLAAVGLIGQKAGLATSLPDQVRQVLSVVGTALAGVSASYNKEIEKQAASQKRRERRETQEDAREMRVKKGEWHDGRVDAVAGTGVTSELGVGDERVEGWGGEGVQIKGKDGEGMLPVLGESKGEKEMSEERQKEEETTEKPKDSWLPTLALPTLGSLSELPDAAAASFKSLPGKIFRTAEDSEATEENDEDNMDPERLKRASVEAQKVRALPIVVLKHYTALGGGHKDAEEVMDVLAKWVAGLVDNQVAHVVVVSDKRENAKRLARALPTKPLHTIALSDADTASALSYVKNKLSAPAAGAPASSPGPAANAAIEFGKSETARIEQLGGRTSDLDSLVHKVRAGQSVPDAVEDIIRRDTGELRKNAFGDDIEDAKKLPWTREQAWSLVRRLDKEHQKVKAAKAKGGQQAQTQGQAEVEAPYYDVLVGMFANDEAALRSMEHAELISITTDNAGRPSAIRPGKPVYKYVFERLVSDPVFAATQDLALKDKGIAKAETMIKACEEELLRLNEIGSSRAARRREDYLLAKMRDAQSSLETLEGDAGELKKVLAKGG